MRSFRTPGSARGRRATGVPMDIDAALHHEGVAGKIRMPFQKQDTKRVQTNIETMVSSQRGPRDFNQNPPKLFFLLRWVGGGLGFAHMKLLFALTSVVITAFALASCCCL